MSIRPDTTIPVRSVESVPVVPVVPVAEVPRADATYMANLTVLLEFESIWNLKYVVCKLCKCECYVVVVF